MPGRFLTVGITLKFSIPRNSLLCFFISKKKYLWKVFSAKFRAEK